MPGLLFRRFPTGLISCHLEMGSRRVMYLSLAGVKTSDCLKEISRNDAGEVDDARKQDPA